MKSAHREAEGLSGNGQNGQKTAQNGQKEAENGRKEPKESLRRVWHGSGSKGGPDKGIDKTPKKNKT